MEAESTQDPSRRHTCTYCGNGFRKPEHLRRHTRIHTKEKPYKCHCGSSFSRRDLLQRHERLAHQGGQPEAVQSRATTATAATAAAPEPFSPDNLEGQSITAATPPQAPGLQPSAARPPSISLHTEDHPLYDFHNFLGNSSLLGLVNDPASGEAVQGVGTSQPAPATGPAVASQNPGSIGQVSTPINNACEPDLSLVMSDPSIQEYLTLNPGFSLPSPQTAGRYFTSFFQNFKFQFVHKVYMRPDNLSVVLRPAMLALGARYLFEVQNASSLFNASKAISTNIWTSSQHGVPRNSHGSAMQLGATFLLLLEYVKAEQSQDLDREMHFLQSGLNFHLSLSWRFWNHPLGYSEQEGESIQWAQVEMTRRIQVYGFCTAAAHAFLFDFVPTLPMHAPYLELPCSDEFWAKSTLEELEQRGQSVIGDTDHLFVWIERVMAQAGKPTTHQAAHQVDTVALQFGYLIAGLLSHRIAIHRDAWLPGSSDTAKWDEYERISRTATRCILALQASTTSNLKPTALSCEAETLFRLVQLRLVFDPTGTGIRSLYTQSPLTIATAFHECSGPDLSTGDTLRSAIDHCIDILEEPATTGITYFVRSRTSSWGLESLVLVFESTLLLCKWMCKVNTATAVHQDESRMVRRIQTLVPSAWSSIDGVKDLPSNLSTEDLAFVLVRFWAQVFRAPENKPFTRFLGECLCAYLNMTEVTASLL